MVEIEFANLSRNCRGLHPTLSTSTYLRVSNLHHGTISDRLVAAPTLLPTGSVHMPPQAPPTLNLLSRRIMQKSNGPAVLTWNLPESLELTQVLSLH